MTPHRTRSPDQLNSPELVGALEAEEVFVFASNAAGVHRRGAAAAAFRHFGAEWGVARGMRGQSFALDASSAESLSDSVRHLFDTAHVHHDRFFIVAAVPALAPAAAAALFSGAPRNVILPTAYTAVGGADYHSAHAQKDT